MNELEEGNLRFCFEGARHALKFDQTNPELPDYHDLDEMPKVDFVVEMDDCIYFVEVKDPGRPDAADAGGTKFLKKIVKGTVEASLIEKYLFTFFFRWAENRLDKSVHYVSLITLEDPMLQYLSDSLDKQLYKHFLKKSSRWSRIPLVSCQVLNIESWNEVFPEWPINRLPSDVGNDGT